jgi:hypothetical protein
MIFVFLYVRHKSYITNEKVCCIHIQITYSLRVSLDICSIMLIQIKVIDLNKVYSIFHITYIIFCVMCSVCVRDIQ